MKIAVVIPGYRVKETILPLLARIDKRVDRIYFIDDACPESSGAHVKTHARDRRVHVLQHDQNQGVGGAVLTGYRQALFDGMDIVVKIDGDGQMDPALLPAFTGPIERGEADYTKGNRFFDLSYLSRMPRLRLLGNAALSFISKLVSGYWQIMDPTNGYTAIHAAILRMLPLEKLDRRYFFESDLLFRLNVARAVVQDVPMVAAYAAETSHLRIGRVLLEFPFKYLNRFFKRLFYNYFLRDFNLGTLGIVIGLPLMLGGAGFGLYEWLLHHRQGADATAGEVMLAALPILLGFQLVLFVLLHDIICIPRQVLWPRLVQGQKMQDRKKKVGK